MHAAISTNVIPVFCADEDRPGPFQGVNHMILHTVYVYCHRNGCLLGESGGCDLHVNGAVSAALKPSTHIRYFKLLDAASLHLESLGIQGNVPLKETWKNKGIKRHLAYHSDG